MWLKGIKPAHILFCDTGGEREETYQFIATCFRPVRRKAHLRLH
jgi:hypothetical protein